MAGTQRFATILSFRIVVVGGRCRSARSAPTRAGSCAWGMLLVAPALMAPGGGAGFLCAMCGGTVDRLTHSMYGLDAHQGGHCWLALL